MQVLPTHMRHLERMAIDTLGRQGLHLASDKSQSPMLPEFLAGLQQHLSAEADTQQRHTRLGTLAQHIRETTCRQFMHSVTEGPDTRQDQA